MEIKRPSIDAFLANKSCCSKIGKVRISSMGDLSGFLNVGSNTLVRISNKDFWKIGKDENGFFIEKLVDDSEGPLSD